MIFLPLIRRSVLGFLISLAMPLAFARAATEPTLIIKTETKTLSFKRSALLARKDAQTLKIDHDPTFPGRTMTYRAVPLHKLFSGLTLQKGAALEFECLDGFSAPIDKDRLLNSSKERAMAYLAIERPGEKWPKIARGGHAQTPAPYYLVWVNPASSNIGPEEWPYQLSGFSAHEPLETRYPRMAPDPKLSSDDPVVRGFKSFAKHCFACHRMNLEGQSQMGPDLNVPMNPTEYLTPQAFEILVRNPQSLRHWPQAKMSPFSKKTLPEAEFADLATYLKYMTTRKVEVRQVR